MKKSPFPGAVLAKKHTPIYSVHRYFARRPHNVFASIVEHYLDQPSVILDPFMGGGVTAIEGLSLGHRVIGHEVNSLACFIVKGELAIVDSQTISQAVTSCLAYCNEQLSFSYAINGREVYWYGWDSVTECSHCAKEVRLRADLALGAGSYECSDCHQAFRPLRVAASSIAPSSVCAFQKGAQTTSGASLLRVSRDRLAAHHQMIDKKLRNSPFALPLAGRTPIPKCNLERESALHAKGFRNFEDFVTEKNQAWILCFAKAIEDGEFDDETKDALYYILSAAIRYISRFSCLNSAWRKGLRPLEWAKSNFWTPYAFVEVNPSIAIKGRLEAYLDAVTDHRRRFGRMLRAGTPKSVVGGTAEYAIANGPSQMLNLPDESVDLILTDPPYGSYLNYGELSGFWLAWLKRLHPKMRSVRIVNSQEAIASRKKHADNYKNFGDYERELSQVFLECNRVLKPERYMVFTFNNKEPEAWVALLRAVKKAGFELPEGGVIFQDGVEAYKRTIALRRDGAIHGDFIYSFLKPKRNRKSTKAKSSASLDWRAEVLKVMDVMFEKRKEIKNTDLFLEVNRSLLPQIFLHLSVDETLSTLADFTMRNLSALLEQNLSFDSGFWRRPQVRSSN